MPDLNDELVRLRRLRETTLAIVRRAGLSPEDRLRAIERILEDAGTVHSPSVSQALADEEAEAEEARDRDRLS